MPSIARLTTPRFLTAIAGALILCAALVGQARADAVVSNAVEAHILPGFEALESATAALAETCGAACAPEDPAVREAYHAAFDAWMGVSHLRFGPVEDAQRGFALAFWPDARGATPKALKRFLRAGDEALLAPETYAKQSVAARGFFALERLLYDADLGGEPAYRDRLIAAVARDIATTAAAIAADWQGGYAETMTTAGAEGNTRYLDTQEARRALFTALSTGLETTGDLRLGRPLGTFERPRPNRAEARRSERSQRHVILSLEALRDLAAILATDVPQDVSASVDGAFARALEQGRSLDDPAFAGVASPGSRIGVEALQVRVTDIRRAVALELGAALGIAAGFNSLDGD
ncbi:MAG: imelysin family protein [Pseudomonadota bacterium]